MESSRLENLRCEAKKVRGNTHRIARLSTCWIFDFCQRKHVHFVLTSASFLSHWRSVPKTPFLWVNQPKKKVIQQNGHWKTNSTTCVHLKETLILRLLETIIVFAYLAKSVTKKYNFFTWKMHFEQCPFFFWVTIDGECMWDERTIMEGPSKKKDSPKCLSTSSQPFSKPKACSQATYNPISLSMFPTLLLYLVSTATIFLSIPKNHIFWKVPQMPLKFLLEVL